jgi:hypothetical protein
MAVTLGEKIMQYLETAFFRIMHLPFLGEEQLKFYLTPTRQLEGGISFRYYQSLFKTFTCPATNNGHGYRPHSKKTYYVQDIDKAVLQAFKLIAVNKTVIAPATGRRRKIST